MAFRVLLFAAVAQAAGTRELMIEVPGHEPTLSNLLEIIARDRPALAALLPRCAVAVNESYAAPTRTLTPGDEIAIIPPVSGG